MAHSAHAVAAVPEIIKQLCGLVRQLDGLFPERSFTLDGHLVGSIGEVLAADRYGLTLLGMTEAKHDARSADNRLVQIKTTQGAAVGLRSEPDYLLVVQLLEDGTIEEVFNGPGTSAWKEAGKMQKNGQRSIGLTKLRRLMADVPPAERISARDSTRAESISSG